MTSDEINRLRKLVSENELETAIDTLVARTHTQKEPFFREAALHISSQFKQYRKHELLGTVSHENLGIERAKITNQFLELLHDIENGKIPAQKNQPSPTKKNNKLILLCGALMVLAAVYFLLPSHLFSENKLESFSIIAHLENANSPINIFENEKMGITVGPHKIDPKKANENGEIIFDNIPGKYIQDSIRLNPADPKFLVKKQNFFMAKNSREIIFVLEKQTASTTLRGCLTGKNNNAIVGATLIFDSKYLAETNELGCYEIALPIADGDEVELQIRLNGKIIRQPQNRVVFEGQPLNLILTDFGSD